MGLSAIVRELSATASETAGKIPRLACDSYTYKNLGFGSKEPVCQIDGSDCPFASSQEWKGGTVYFCRKGRLTEREIALLEKIAVSNNRLTLTQIPLSDGPIITGLERHGYVEFTPSSVETAVNGKVGEVTEQDFGFYSIRP